MTAFSLFRDEFRRNRAIWTLEWLLLALIVLSLPLFFRAGTAVATRESAAALLTWGVTLSLALCGGFSAGYDARNRCGELTASLPVSGFRLWLARYGSVWVASIPGFLLVELLAVLSVASGDYAAVIFAVLQAICIQSIVFQVTLGARSESNRVMFLGFAACFLLFLAGPVWYGWTVAAAWPASLTAGWWYYTRITLRGRNAPTPGILAALALVILILITLGRFS